MTTPTTISAYRTTLPESDQTICDVLNASIATGLPEAEGKIWHAYPVWFLNGNPIVGYSKVKVGISLMFWSGQDFELPGLTPSGSFKAAVARFADASEIDGDLVVRWLGQSRLLQWDYKNIVKRKGVLERLPTPLAA